MSYQLVIAEKPSVARSIAGVIGADKKQDGYMEGNGYLVSWCIGHLVSLADAGTYDERFKKWRYDDLPILPQECPASERTAGPAGAAAGRAAGTGRRAARPGQRIFQAAPGATAGNDRQRKSYAANPD